jgi:hypothetical protein
MFGSGAAWLSPLSPQLSRSSWRTTSLRWVRSVKGGKLTASEINLLLVATTQRDISRIYSRIDEAKLDINKRIDAR